MKPEGSSKIEPAEKPPHLVLRRWLPVVIQIWMTGVLILFVVIRVLGSSSAQVFLRRWGAR
jgi:hypothetical protein